MFKDVTPFTPLMRIYRFLHEQFSQLQIYCAALTFHRTFAMSFII